MYRARPPLAAHKGKRYAADGRWAGDTAHIIGFQGVLRGGEHLRWKGSSKSSEHSWKPFISLCGFHASRSPDVTPPNFLPLAR